MNIFLNGESREIVDGCTVAQLLEILDFTDRRLAVEVNLEIVPRSGHARHRLTAGDKVEIVHAIGGG